MRTARQLTTAAALAVTSAGLCAAPASAGPAGGLQVTPATVTPGTTVTVNTTACGRDATATGDASAVGAGTFALASKTRAEVASGRFKVPPSAQPGTYEIVARCAGSGGREVALDTRTDFAAAVRREAARTERYDRPATVADWVMMNPLGDAMQSRTWEETVERVVVADGGLHIAADPAAASGINQALVEAGIAVSELSRTAPDNGGVAVTYSFTATDVVDGTDPVDCVPPSGTVFAVGATTGELRRFTQLADVVFVGKSLPPHTEGPPTVTGPAGPVTEMSAASIEATLTAVSSE